MTDHVAAASDVTEREQNISAEATPSPAELVELKRHVAAIRLRLKAAKLEGEIGELQQELPADIKTAVHEVRLARLIKEKSDLKPLPDIRWWHSWGSVAGVVAMITAMVPITTAVFGYFGNERAVAMERAKNDLDIGLKKQQLDHQEKLEQTKQVDEIARGYLALSQDPEQRARTLRFAEKTAPIPDVRSWAQAELGLVQEEIAQVKRDSERYRVAALPQRCLRWDYENVYGKVPESVGRRHCQSRADKEMAKKGDVIGNYYVKGTDGTWQESGSVSLDGVNCKCVEARPEEAKKDPL